MRKYLLFLILISSELYGQTLSGPELTFIGNRNKLSYFQSQEDGRLAIYRFQNNELIEDNELKGEHVIFVNESLQIIRGLHSIVIRSNQGEKEIDTPGTILEVIASPNAKTLLVLMENDSIIKRLDLSSEKWENTEIVGFNLQAVNDHIYYAQFSGQSTQYVHVFQTGWDDLSTGKLFAKSLFKDDLVVAGSEDIIACMVPIKGRPIRAIFNVAMRRSYLLTRADKVGNNAKPFYDYGSADFIFYGRNDDQQFTHFPNPQSYTYNHTFD